MPRLTIFAFFVLIAGLALIAFSARAVTTISLQPEGPLRHAATWASAFVFSIIGVAAAGAGSRMFMPAGWGFTGKALLLSACCVASAAFSAFWTWKSQRDWALLAAQLAARDASPSVPTFEPAAMTGRRQTWPHPGLAAGLAAIRAQRELRSAKLVRTALTWAILSACIAGLSIGISNLFFGLIAALCAGAFVFSLISQYHLPVDGIGELEYRTLPGAIDAFGKQRCVYCGKSGVYRQGAYASNSTWHQCTGCRKHLFVD